ncbi:MAG TPA: phenylalanine--tRNA ligase subunit beta [Lentisphaeria bacterium]|nr:MAG: phenylalanine--tRNA ligase subunit beta [Lentisphaerae bacterium GWF2_49_21]HBC85791.1 phenylalanine--tRNA ligase subunit beta [Lentisphaeria bacterium]
MKVSYNWLSQYVDMGSDGSDLVEKLTMAGVEVEDVIRTSVPAGVIVAEILERNKHPNADKLSVCRVSTGKEELLIVCGAPNCDAGQKVPLATIGTVFIDKETGKEFNIKKAKLRGVESSGMICSEKELGLSEQSSGIMVLPKDAPLGITFNDYMKADTVYDLEITPNRPDLLSHIGIAREIAALCGGKVKYPETRVSPRAKIPPDTVEIMDGELCPRYTARIIRNVNVAESPEWLKQRLKSVGLRPINNIVDITNFVLLELGQPLHAFDLSLLEGQKIIVRRAVDDEKIIALDGREYKLNKNNLVICDLRKPVALAGIMGGEHSGVVETTKDVLLESAYFKPSNIRSSSKELGISTDSSYRFERGVDFEMVLKASDRASALILELAGGEATEMLDVCVSRPEIKPVSCRFEKIRRTLGVGITNNEIAEIFTKLELGVTEVTSDSCKVVPTSFRSDLREEADLAEEVARIYGLDKIPLVSVSAVAGGSFKMDAYVTVEEVRNQLVALGLDEVMNYSYADEKAALADSRYGKDRLLAMSNPISHESAFLRPSLLSGMLRTVEHNISRKNADLAIFEIGNVYCGNSKNDEEKIECCIAMSGRKHPERFSHEKKALYDFYDLKGVLESLLESRKIGNCEVRRCTENQPGNFVESTCAELLVDGQRIAVFGEITGRLTKGIRIQCPLFAALVDMEKLLAVTVPKIQYSQISLFPSVTRDVAMVMPDSIEHAQIIKFIRSLGIPNLEKVEIFDEFRDENIGVGKKSLAYTLTFRCQDRTLTDAEVNASHDKVREKLKSELHAELR